CQQGTNWPVTF
nr:immunoglobulin light chain junction region [Macaca mulatta]MOW08254.1 immunoglobulin light chain junction region [Macaca mulatta]MOW11939.1 immunoglobulin light chain junction region [Macaca mulatta]